MKSTLEKTIISLASGYLKEMGWHKENIKAEMEMDNFISCFHSVTALTEVAHIADSGLSEAAVQLLNDIEMKAAKLIACDDNSTEITLTEGACQYCGKLPDDYDLATDGNNCLDAGVFSPAAGDWLCVKSLTGKA